MKLLDQTLAISPTDLAYFLACRHRTALDERAARGELPVPDWADPFVDALRFRGEEHERHYIQQLRNRGLVVADLTSSREAPRPAAIEATAEAMRSGADVIVQAPLGDDRWFGYADILLRTDTPSELGTWSYEAHDTKLARETKGGTILQLCVYSELTGALQGRAPALFRVVTPLGVETYRFGDFAAFYRSVKARLDQRLAGDLARTYPDPVDLCEMCRWWTACNRQRRHDDHLRFVAGLGRVHQAELTAQGISTLAALAELAVPLQFRPQRGARETYEKLRHQASLQKRQRDSLVPVYDLLPVVPDLGLSLLPEPTPHDLFFDIEGDPFAREGGREYLFGIGSAGATDPEFTYSSRWAFNDAEERAAFEDVIDRIMATLEACPEMHVFHFGAYEASALKRLAGRYAVREPEVDKLLRGDRLVDLYAVVRHALRAGVESYSIKELEPFYRFRRDVELARAGDHRRVVEIGLETRDLDAVTAEVRAAVEGYNRDDCRSTLELRRWLESLRDEQLAADVDVPRPPPKTGEPTDKVRDRDRKALDLRARLLARPEMADLPDVEQRTPEQQALFLLAYLVDWHRREERVAWGEFHRLREMADDDLYDEDEAFVGLRFDMRVSQPGPGTKAKTVVDRYIYPDQELEVRPGAEVKLRDDTSFGTIEALDRDTRRVDVRKRQDQTDVHPETLFVVDVFPTPQQEASVHRTAERTITVGLSDESADRVVSNLLLVRPPRLTDGRFEPADGEDPTDFAVRVGLALDDSLLAIQGPPGAGKTYTGARMIAALAAAGRKVGVVATSHKVIRKLLLDGATAARGQGVELDVAHKPGDDELDTADGIEVAEPKDNKTARAWLSKPGARVLGGTAYLWSRPEFATSVDVLLVDEAGQISLANTLAVAPAGRSLVLLGDPQQLRQPKKGSHPDGVDVSALEHVLTGHQTMPRDRGIFLPTTWRLAPAVCRFTSEAFYDGRLDSEPRLDRQVLSGTGPVEGAGLWLLEVEHTGNRNASPEEAEVVAQLVADMLADGATWTDMDGASHAMTPACIRVVAPFNAQVTRIREALTKLGASDVPTGTVDRFQGQEAPVAIYSMGTSHPDDAPRGMQFLYSLNRLNVATSRARCAAIVVASPKLFEPECRTPAQMRLANALCRFRELATVIPAEVPA